MAESKKKQNNGLQEYEKKIKERFPDLDKWRSMYAPRKLNLITVEDKIAVLRPVGAKEIGNFSMMVGNGEGIDTAIRYMLEELWLGGDNELRDDEEYFISAMLEVQKIIEVKKSSFLKL
ncbi:MAG: hypothetical protein LIO93_08455 [Bacteroidales bacterium]|nr:hypothetical protein [Bacteroidales bacterium]